MSRAVDLTHVSNISLNSGKGGKQISSHDSFSIQEKKKGLKQGVGSHCHFPLTRKISQHVKAVAIHPGMDSGQVKGSTCRDFDLSFYSGPQDVIQFSVATKIRSWSQ